MDLTIHETATVLGISERAVRSRLRRGTLTGRKRDGRWLIHRHALPLDATQRKRLHAKADALRDAVEAALPAAVRQRPAHRLEDLDVFRLGRDLLRDLPADPRLDPMRGSLRAALDEITREGRVALPRAQRRAAMRVRDAMAGRPGPDMARSLAATAGVVVF